MKIKSTWGRVFKDENICLINEFPKILMDLNRFEELDQWFTYDDDKQSEVFQWYIIEDASFVEWLEQFCPEIYQDIHYSETLGHYILAVYHLGTGWDYVPCEMEVNDEIYPFYKKAYHDDLPDDVKKMVFHE